MADHLLAAILPPILPATQALRLLRDDRITVEGYARALLARIEARDGIVNAWAYLDPEYVLDQARVLDKVPRDKRGPLHGLDIGVKDVMETKDMPTQYQSPLYNGYQSGGDAAVVAILRQAGALIFGKTTTSEFTVTNNHPSTANPHDPARAQTGGSLIRPASFTGVFAIKPTHNAIDRQGCKAFAPTFDTLGSFARSIDDLRLLADVLCLKDDTTPPSSMTLGSITVALIKTPFWPRAGPGTAAAMILKEHGVTVEEISLPSEIGNDAAALKQMQNAIMSGEARATFLREYRMDTEPSQLALEIRELVENAGNHTHAELLQATDKLSAMRPVMDKLAVCYSAILTPSAVDEAPLGLDDMGSPAFNTLWTGIHMPVINIPAFKGANGMPIGVSLVAGRYQDQHLLQVAKLLTGILMAGGGLQIPGGLV